MSISSPHPEWAEQEPEDWWTAVCMATRKLLAKTQVPPEQIAAIGISYQMHGLVALDEQGRVLRPAIIWCDSRAVAIGNQAFNALGEKDCLEHYLNSPGNFTASKLRWIKENEPEVFAKIHNILLPGDYIAYRMTGEICTTITGLSEGVLWDFQANTPAKALMEYYQIPESMLAPLEDTFGWQGDLTREAAAALGLAQGTPVTYRAGDQPNNAFSLNVMHPGEVAATGGTSGVLYAVSAKPVFDARQRVNSFAHVNYSPENPITGVLMCINGAGSLYRWVREQVGQGLSYSEMEKLAAEISIGSEGLCILPFGNGAERLLENSNPGAKMDGLHFNRHDHRHIFRAALEGIAFTFVYGAEVFREMGIPMNSIRVGNDNLFQSAIFAQTIATLTGIKIEILATNGAVAAAKAAGVSEGIYSGPENAAAQALQPIASIEPDQEKVEAYRMAYARWRSVLGD